MRRVFPLGLMALLLFLASPLQAQDVTGSWDLTWETPRGTRTTTVALAQDGADVTGTATMQMMGRPGGGGDGGTQEIAISDGAMDGDQLTFSITLGMGDRTFTQTFAATVSGDTMEGTVTGGMRSTDPIPFTGQKKEG
ncbi:hypothetical protein ACFL3S_07500 [Gemmatimonadota bacterium]